MFNFFKHYKEIQKDVSNFKSKVRNADNKQKELIKKLFLIGIALTIIIGVVQIAIVLFVYNPEQVEIPQNNIEETIEHELPEGTGVIELEQEDQGRGQTIPDPIDMLNPFSSFQESIVDAISEIIYQGLELFDDYVSFTPNIAQRDGQIVDARGNNIPIKVNKFYNATQSVAWMFLPLIIVITGTYVVLEGSFKGAMLLKEIAKKTLLFVIGMVSMRFFFASAIDLTNALNKFMLQNLVGSADTLSESLLVALGLEIVEQKLEFTIQGTLNIFAEIILWIGLFFLLVTLLFQFIIRFFHLLLHMIMFPVVFVIGLLPSGGQFFKSYLEEVLRTLFMQPIFLIGIGIAIEIITSVDEPVPKVILGLGSLAFLNLIPAIINRFSGILWGVGGTVAGGIVAGATINQARKLKDGVVSGASGGKSSSIRNLTGKALGSAIVSKLPIGGTAKKAMDAGTKLKTGSSSIKTSKLSFKEASAKGLSATKTFAKLGMKPLDKRIIKSINKPATLYSTEPDFSKVKDFSVKDSNIVSNGFDSQNISSAFEGYPMTDKPASIHQMMDLSNVSFSNPNTSQYVNDSIQPQQVEYTQGRTFDAGDKRHWKHITQWYQKNETVSGNSNPQQIQQFIQNPKNKMKIIEKAHSEGYFQSQGINSVKVKKVVKGQKPVNRFYKLKKK